jgi:hypothetical protein
MKWSEGLGINQFSGLNNKGMGLRVRGSDVASIQIDFET